ncbi:MAG: hypothetical protein KC912_17800 [Proteobacteria bacterium]|nr:hypothetical protein [Pseudomonadota bacterium]
MPNATTVSKPTPLPSRNLAGLALVMALLASPAAEAGGGPWTLSGDDLSTYVGVSYTRWRTFLGGEGAEAVKLPSAVTRTDLGGEVTYGLLTSVDVEVRGGIGWSGIGRADADICAQDTACDSTLSLTPIRARGKVRLLDELRGAPFTLAVGPEVRFGDFTREQRMRVTALGDGQTDVALFASVGRLGGLGSMSYSTYIEGIGRHRLASTEILGQKVPADEISASGEFLLYPTPNVSAGLAVDALHSIGGLDFGEVPLDDPDRFTALSVTSVKLGGKIGVRSVQNTTLSISVLGTLYAENNPADFFTVGVGIGSFRASGEGK